MVDGYNGQCRLCIQLGDLARKNGTPLPKLPTGAHAHQRRRAETEGPVVMPTASRASFHQFFPTVVMPPKGAIAFELLHPKFTRA